MHVVSLAPVPVSSMVWRYADGPWTLSVVCKITMRLEPETARIAKSHDPIHERDIAGASNVGVAHAPADLIPLRTAVDVTLVGDAYAAGVTGPVTARLTVGDIDRRAKVEPRGGSCPAPMAFAPLAGTSPMRQELLVGAPQPALDGDEMSLPVGFDMDFFAAAPAAQRLDELDPGAALRLEHLHPDHRVFETHLPNVSPQVFVQRGRKRTERPATIDGLWIDSRRALATLSWRCMIPLTSRDEAGRVWVTVAGPGRRMSSSQLSELIRELGGRDEPDVDDDAYDDDDPMNRTVAIPIKRPPLPRRKNNQKRALEATKVDSVIPTPLANSGQHTSALELGVLKATADAGPSWLNREASSPEPAASKQDRPKKSATAAPRRPPPSLPPPAPPAPPSLPPPAPPAPPAMPSPPAPPAPSTLVSPSALPSASVKPGSSTTKPLGPSPASLGALNAPAAGKSTAAASAKTAAPASPWSNPGMPPPLRDSKLEDTASLPVGQAAHAQKSMAKASSSLSAALSSVSESLASPKRTAAPARPVSLASPPSLMQSKMASASVSKAQPTTPAAIAKTKAPAAKKVRKPRRGSTRPIDMLWFDAAATVAIRQRWTTLCTELDFAPPNRHHDLPTDDPELARAHHTHFGVLAQVQTVDRGGLRSLLQQSVAEDGRFTPPLCGLDGELKVSFNPVEALRALVVAMKPFATDDKKLENAIESVTNLLDDDASTSQTLQSGRRHVREVFKSSKRSTSLDTLDQAVDRTLLEQRKYDKRTLLGATWIRSKLQWGSNAIVCYLNEELQNRLPMMMSFEARVIGEAQPRQDQFETPPYAMRVVTLGRFIKF